MPFRVRFGIKGLGRFLLLRGERRYFARFFLPLLDQRGIAHDFDLPLKISEAHAPAVTLFVETAKLRLVTVMIGWSQQSPARSFARDAAEIALDRIVQGHVDGVKLLPQQAKGGVFKSEAIRRDGARFAQTKERGCVLRFYPDVIALRYLQKETRQHINRIRRGASLDLGCDIFKRGCLRKKMDVELRQWRWRRSLARHRKKIPRTFPILALKQLAIISFSSITPAAILLTVTAVTRWTRASIRGLAWPVGLLFFSFKSGMTRHGPIVLHPCGKEFQVDQIEWLAGRWHLSHLLHQVEK